MADAKNGDYIWFCQTAIGAQDPHGIAVAQRELARTRQRVAHLKAELRAAGPYATRCDEITALLDTADTAVAAVLTDLELFITELRSDQFA